MASAPAYMIAYPATDPDKKIGGTPVKTTCDDNFKLDTSAGAKTQDCIRLTDVSVSAYKQGGTTTDGKMNVEPGGPTHVTIETIQSHNVMMLLEQANTNPQFDLKIFLFRAGLEDTDLPKDERGKANKGKDHHWFTIEIKQAQLLHQGIFRTSSTNYQLSFAANQIRFIDHLSTKDGLYHYADRKGSKG